jgi:HAD domain in Swiss Army Knife RNA repair proteins
VNVLFLDIDGVLHPNGTVTLEPDGSISAVGAFRWLQSFDAVLQDFPDTEVVLHSSWHLLWETDIELKSNLPKSLAERIRGTTPRTVLSRYASIEAYCAEHGVTQFCIIDDERATFPAGLSGLVVCDQVLGISSPQTQAELRAALAELKHFVQ